MLYIYRIFCGYIIIVEFYCRIKTVHRERKEIAGNAQAKVQARNKKRLKPIPLVQA